MNTIEIRYNMLSEKEKQKVIAFHAHSLGIGSGRQYLPTNLNMMLLPDILERLNPAVDVDSTYMIQSIPECRDILVELLKEGE